MHKTLSDWHYARPKLAQKYLDLFALGLTSSRCLFARRRMGKTEFLKKDLILAAERKGYWVVYVNLWELKTDPEAAIITEFHRIMPSQNIRKIKLKASGKISGIFEGGIETEFQRSQKIAATPLTKTITAFDKTKMPLLFVIDEAQVLAQTQNSDFAHTLRAALDIRKDRIKVVFAGSSENTFRNMFGVPSSPFYNWAPLEPFELLGDEFVTAMVSRVNSICKIPLSLKDALHAFSELKNTPEFFRRYIEYYLGNPEKDPKNILKEATKTILNDDNLKQPWESLLPVDQTILLMISQGVTDLYGKSSLAQLGSTLGIDEVSKNTVQNALRRLIEKNILTRLEHGTYQFEDQAFADWVKHKE